MSKKKKDNKVPNPKQEKYKQFRVMKDKRIEGIKNLDVSDVDQSIINQNEKNIMNFLKSRPKKKKGKK